MSVDIPLFEKHSNMVSGEGQDSKIGGQGGDEVEESKGKIQCSGRDQVTVTRVRYGS